MKIRIVVNGTPVTATLDDNETSRDFVSLLPLTLTLEDYNSTEKISNLPKKLSTEDAPAGIDPSVGDIAYYAPWGNLAIFYKDFAYSPGLVKWFTGTVRIDPLFDTSHPARGLKLSHKRSWSTRRTGRAWKHSRHRGVADLAGLGRAVRVGRAF